MNHLNKNVSFNVVWKSSTPEHAAWQRLPTDNRPRAA